MKLNSEFYKVAVKACADVYKNNTDLGTTEFRHAIKTINGRRYQVLAIAGTNEWKDWLININLFSRKGIKYGAYKAAKDINEKLRRYKGLPLLVCGHSKAGATAIAFKRLFGAEYCIAFAPARSIRPWAKKEMENTVLFIDPDDIVSKLAFISFTHPICTVIKAREDHDFYSIGDHKMKHWIEFVSKMVD